MDTPKQVVGKRHEVERRLESLTELLLRERAAAASGPHFANLDLAFHHVRVALGRVRGESET